MRVVMSKARRWLPIPKMTRRVVASCATNRGFCESGCVEWSMGTTLFWGVVVLDVVFLGVVSVCLSSRLVFVKAARRGEEMGLSLMPGDVTSCAARKRVGLHCQPNNNDFE